MISYLQQSVEKVEIGHTVLSTKSRGKGNVPSSVRSHLDDVEVLTRTYLSAKSSVLSDFGIFGFLVFLVFYQCRYFDKAASLKTSS